MSTDISKQLFGKESLKVVGLIVDHSKIRKRGRNL